MHLQIHHVCRRSHVAVRICHDQKQSNDDQRNDQHAATCRKTPRDRPFCTIVSAVKPRDISKAANIAGPISTDLECLQFNPAFLAKSSQRIDGVSVLQFANFRKTLVGVK
jgi:hypothetical protein